MKEDGHEAADGPDQQREQEEFLIVRQTEAVEEVRRPQFYAVPLAPELRALQGETSHDSETITSLNYGSREILAPGTNNV
jgi:hypothetical protein